LSDDSLNDGWPASVGASNSALANVVIGSGTFSENKHRRDGGFACCMSDRVRHFGAADLNGIDLPSGLSIVGQEHGSLLTECCTTAKGGTYYPAHLSDLRRHNGGFPDCSARHCTPY
jgi:hypothetical protein